MYQRMFYWSADIFCRLHLCPDQHCSLTVSKYTVRTVPPTDFDFFYLSLDVVIFPGYRESSADTAGLEIKKTEQNTG